MKINGRVYGFTIDPHYNKVLAEIYKESTITIGKTPTHIQLISKSFGKWYRKPIESDYMKARNWVKKQMLNIQEANKEI